MVKGHKKRKLYMLVNFDKAQNKRHVMMHLESVFIPNPCKSFYIICILKVHHFVHFIISQSSLFLMSFEERFRIK